MKTVRNILMLFITLLAFGTQAHAQRANKYDTLHIKTSAECQMCKERIEKVLAYEKGVKSSDLDTATQVLVVVYKVKKTNPDRIRKVISDTGYDADNVPADPNAYAELPDCCKKGAHGHNEEETADDHDHHHHEEDGHDHEH